LATFEFWRDITVGSPFDTVNRYQYDTSDDSIAHDTFNVPTGNLGEIHPPFGTVMYSECVSGDLIEYKSSGSSASINEVTTANDPSCCTLVIEDFVVSKTNNNIVPPATPNGQITITSPVLDIGLYEASINGGGSWVTQIGSVITFSNLPAGGYSVIIREISGVCSVTSGLTITDHFTYPPLLIAEHTLPALYSPVFHPILISYQLLNNTATIKTDGQVYLEATSDDAKDYLGTLPIIRIIDNEDYAGTYQVTGVDNLSTPTKFYFNGTYVSNQTVLFVPFDRQVFQLYAEVAVDNLQRLADITAYPDEQGKYNIRLEGFLQAAFNVIPPVSNGIDISSLIKFYVMPRDFELNSPATHRNAVYSAIPNLTNYLGDLIPLGPAPINFINEKTAEGMKVLFSYINTTTGRIENITSSNETDIVSTSPVIYLPALPLNTYTLTWVNPAGVIGSLNVTPALPDWITLEPSAADTVLLTIETFTEGATGDYEGDDYDGTDYLTGGPNGIVGCYSFEFKDGATLLFTLEICVYPISKSDLVCEGGFNIAWRNLEGGWSSYYFTGRKVYGQEIGTVNSFKKGNQLRRGSVEDVYDYVEVVVANRAVKDLQFISSLKKSIQAYLYSENTLQWSIPIYLERQSGTVYQTPFKQIEQLDRFTFKYAEEVVIQTQ
jgi:hypothetical protein